jgi:hypothetical protein
MAQRIYWVPHTVCFFGCEHCHNDSVMEGIRADRTLIDRIIANLPGPDSPYRLEEVLVGGGEALMRNQQMEYLVRAFRARFPRGPQATLEERREAGYVTLALQTMGFPLADAHARPLPRTINYWLDLGVDHFHIASNDIFHERQRPDYDWEALRRNLREYGAAHGIHFLIYGKAPARLVPSGRVLDTLETLETLGASLLTEPGYCATAWEAAANFLSGTHKQHPECSEVVIDPHGWVHPCCWHELAPGLFNLAETPFAEGMAYARTIPFCQALDAGDMIGLAQLAGVDPLLAHQVRDRVGDCGACRLCSVRLAHQPQNRWLQPTSLSPRETRFYQKRLGTDLLNAFLGQTQLGLHDRGQPTPIHLEIG